MFISIYIMQFYSQYKQDKFCYENFFKDKKNGVFLEIGADDGIDFSNTNFYEKELGWTGICIEPRNVAFNKLIKNRSCHCENVAVSDIESENETFLELEGWGKGLSGLMGKYDPKHLLRIQMEKKHPLHKGSHTTSVKVVKLQSLLDKHDIQHVDFCSIDTEGGELDIMASLDWTKTTIDVITIENNYDYTDIRPFFESKGYTLFNKLAIDEIYVSDRLLK
jgi:FkbM family methyltransferase